MVEEKIREFIFRNWAVGACVILVIGYITMGAGLLTFVIWIPFGWPLMFILPTVKHTTKTLPAFVSRNTNVIATFDLNKIVATAYIALATIMDNVTTLGGLKFDDDSIAYVEEQCDELNLPVVDLYFWTYINFFIFSDDNVCDNPGGNYFFKDAILDLFSIAVFVAMVVVVAKYAKVAFVAMGSAFGKVKTMSRNKR